METKACRGRWRSASTVPAQTRRREAVTVQASCTWPWSILPGGEGSETPPALGGNLSSPRGDMALQILVGTAIMRSSSRAGVVQAWASRCGCLYLG